MIKFIADSVEWFDKTYGKTYSSTRIISTETGKTVKTFPFAPGNSHDKVCKFKRSENLNFDNLYETSQNGTRKQAEQWGKL